MKHCIVSRDPFTVLYMYQGLHKRMAYAIPLTHEEILAEYDYITFNIGNKMSSMVVKKSRNGLFLYDGTTILEKLPEVTITD